MSLVKLIPGNAPSTEKGNYYISVGGQSKRYTLRFKYQEKVWVKDEDGRPSSPGLRERDHYVCTLAKDYDRALEKVSTHFTQNNDNPNETVNVYFNEHHIYADSDRNNIDHSIVPFGKYEGKPVFDIDDKEYLSWLAYQSNASTGVSHEKFRDYLNEHLEEMGMDTIEQYQNKQKELKAQTEYSDLNARAKAAYGNEWLRDALTSSLTLDFRVTSGHIRFPQEGNVTEIKFEFEDRNSQSDFLEDMATKLFIKCESILDLSRGQQAAICKVWSKHHSKARVGSKAYKVQANLFTKNLEAMKTPDPVISNDVPSQLFHMTLKENRASILKHGLSVKFDQSGQGGVFLSDSHDGTDTREWDIWAVQTDKLKEFEEDWSGDPENYTWYVTFKTIPASDLTLFNPKEREHDKSRNEDGPCP